MRTFWAIAIGAAVGGVSRYYLASAVQQRVDASFPWGTLLVNVTGSLLLGFLMRYALATPAVTVEMRALLTTGVQVDLPKVKSAPMQMDEAKLLLIITADEHVYLGKDEITQAVEDKLKTNARLQEEKELYVQADENVKNPCGGCTTLEHQPGEACPPCGVYTCAGPEILSCPGTPGPPEA